MQLRNPLDARARRWSRRHCWGYEIFGTGGGSIGIAVRSDIEESRERLGGCRVSGGVFRSRVMVRIIGILESEEGSQYDNLEALAVINVESTLHA